MAAGNGRAKHITDTASSLSRDTRFALIVSRGLSPSAQFLTSCASCIVAITRDASGLLISGSVLNKTTGKISSEKVARQGTPEAVHEAAGAALLDERYKTRAGEPSSYAALLKMA
jgi:hypothetical protein